jgi:hypothetical protein
MTNTAAPAVPIRSPRLRPATTAHELVPGTTPAAFRWWLFCREQNGLDSAVIRIGRRLYVDEDRFFAWLESKRERPAA